MTSEDLRMQLTWLAHLLCHDHFAHGGMNREAITELYAVVKVMLSRQLAAEGL